MVAVGIFCFSLSKMQILSYKYGEKYPEYIEAVKKLDSDPGNGEYINNVREIHQKIDAERQ